MELFHKVPDSILTAFISTAIDENNIIIHAKNLYKINIESTKIATLIEEDLGHNHLAVPFKSSNGNIYLNYWQDSIIIIANGKTSSVYLDWHRYKNSSASSFNFQEVHDKLLLENVGQELYEIDASNLNVWSINQIYQQTKELTRIHNSADGLWLAKNTSGVHFYNLMTPLD